MRSATIAAAMILALGRNDMVARADMSCPDDWECQPLLLFLDDLAAFPYGTSKRDPFEERIETERHDFTQSTKTVGRHVAQLEMGYTYFYKDHNDEIERSHTTPEMLLRVGLSDDIEFRVRWTYVWEFSPEAAHVDSAPDLIWSFKFATTEQCGWIPETATVIRGTVPTGGSEFTVGRVLASADFIYGWELGEGWTLAGSTSFLPSGLGEFSVQAAIDNPQDDHYIVWSQSAALGKELTERNVIYAEWFGLFSYAAEDEFSMSFYNMGIDHYLTDNLVIDFRVGVGLTADADDLFAGVGGGYRF